MVENGVAFNRALAAGTFTDADGASTLIYSATGLPQGLAMASDGKITGTPTVVGAYAVKVTAADDSDAAVSYTFKLFVDTLPVAVASTNTVLEDSKINGNVTAATDADSTAEALSYQLVGTAPTGLTFNPNGSYIFDASSYDSLKAGSTQDVVIAYTAKDSVGGSSAPANLTITITGTNDAPKYHGVLAGATTNSTEPESLEHIATLSNSHQIRLTLSGVDILAQRYINNSPFGPAFKVNTTAADATFTFFGVIALDNGGYVIAFDTGSGNQYDVF